MTPPDLIRHKAAVPRAFDRAALSYDRLTGLNPGYARHLRLSAERLRIPDGGRVLDLCCGTGISTEAILAVAPSADVTGLDGSEGMLDHARRKELRARFVQGDAMDAAAAPGVEGPYDAILMAYGIRNMADPDACLARLLPLLRPGGAVAFHEYSVRDDLAARLVWNAVSTAVIVPGGALVSGEPGLYRYLRRSVNDFDGVRAFEARLRRAGFDDVRTLPMDGWQRGILHTFLARRPSA